MSPVPVLHSKLLLRNQRCSRSSKSQTLMLWFARPLVSPPNARAPSKAPTAKADPLDALAGTLGTRKEDPQAKKPAVDKVKV
ncbi:unnamed protein product, partial [Ranitomeya imitator]